MKQREGTPMIDRLVVRSFTDSAFIFDPVTQNSLFIEGTVSNLVLDFLNDINYVVPQIFWLTIPDEYLVQVREDVQHLRSTIRDFLVNIEKNNRRSSQGAILHGGVQDSPLSMLSAYAIKNWQITNVSIEMTYRCNLRCRWCYLDDYSYVGLSREELQIIANQLKEVGVVFVLFTGGEPFIRRDIIEVMTDYKDLGFALELKSNGLLLSRSLISELANLQLFNFQVSVYGIDDYQSQFTGIPYEFSRLAENIREMVAQELPLSLAVLVGKHNIDDLDRYNDVLLGLGVEEIFFSPYITPNRGGVGPEVDLRLSRKEMDEKFYPFLQKIDGFFLPVKYREHCRDGSACYAGRDQIAINPLGIVYPCLDFQLPLGDLRRENLDCIVERRQQLLEPYKLRRIKKCCNCQIVEYCDSCVGTALLENGCFTEPSQHKCDVSRFYYDSYYSRKEVKR